jgi:DNA-binding Xre family transcriptional regulator
MEIIDKLEVEDMGTIKSKVPELLQSRGWGAMDLVRHGLSIHTAYRLVEGDIDIRVSTLQKLCNIFKVDSVGEVIIYNKHDGANREQ